MRKIYFLILMGLIGVTMSSIAAPKKFTLVIDAGHGGKDVGAPGKTSYEKNINLQVALAFGKLVERNCADVKVIYTRTTDVFVELQERANIANRNKADLFISIHTNALDGGRISRGLETYTLGMHRAADNLAVAKRENSVILIEKNYKQRYAGFDPNSAESYIMFELLQDKNMANSVELAKLIQSEACAASGRVNKGVHQAGFLVLRETSMPSCLIELGFITTADEEQFLNTEDGQGKIAKGIYNAFLKYKKKYSNKDSAKNDEEEGDEDQNLLAQNMVGQSTVEPINDTVEPDRSEDNGRSIIAEESSATEVEYSEQRAVRVINPGASVMSDNGYLAQNIPTQSELTTDSKDLQSKVENIVETPPQATAPPAQSASPSPPAPPTPPAQLALSTPPPPSTPPTAPTQPVQPTQSTAPAQPVQPTQSSSQTQPVKETPSTVSSQPAQPTQSSSPTQPAKETQSTVSSQPAQSSSPAQPAKEAKPNTPAQPTQSSSPAQPTKEAKPTAPAQPTQEAKPTAPAQPAQEAKPTAPAQPAQSSSPSQPAKETKPTAPAQQAKEAKPTTPTQPVKEAKPTASAQPAKEAKPAAPAQPAKEAKPTAPAQPAKEAKPTTPAQPAKEAKPTAPAQPAKEAKPAAPAQPAKEAKPTAPAQPAKEAKPTTPAQPAKEAKPTTPAQPAKESKSTAPAQSDSPVQTASPADSVSSQPDNRPIFKVQIAASSQQLPADSPVFLGLEGVTHYEENGMTKYTVGATPDFEEITMLRKSVAAKFPQAFIIAFRDGKKIELREALGEYRKQQKRQP